VSRYIGRFAPSPTGPLHTGSLLAAMASYLDARKNRGLWLLRIEDIDPPREVSGASESILHCLESFGFEWDGEVLYQSTRLAIYQDILDQLIKADLVYPCVCSRKNISQSLPRTGPLGPIYPNTCKDKVIDLSMQHAFRLRTEAKTVSYEDKLQGRQTTNLANEIGDFVIKRADGLFSYQLAVVIDDEFQGVNNVVRGCDLLENTFAQLYLQKLLAYQPPNYLHIPILVNQNQEKLSKQTGAHALPTDHPLPQLVSAWKLLGQSTDSINKLTTPSEFWEWAIPIWEPKSIPAQRAIRFSD